MSLDAWTTLYHNISKTKTSLTEYFSQTQDYSSYSLTHLLSLCPHSFERPSYKKDMTATTGPFENKHSYSDAVAHLPNNDLNDNGRRCVFRNKVLFVHWFQILSTLVAFRRSQTDQSTWTVQNSANCDHARASCLHPADCTEQTDKRSRNTKAAFDIRGSRASYPVAIPLSIGLLKHP